MVSLLLSRPFPVEEAKQLVEKISKAHGFVDETRLSGLEPTLRDYILDTIWKKDQMIGSSAINLAKNLHNSDARFVFELLRYADDNDFTLAAPNGVEPYVSYEIFPTKIAMEFNGDGFSERNLTAICKVEGDSDAKLQGYRGGKDIGFKSVFMAAYKVHIQSGKFSFSFNHRPGDSGIGMISPVWEDSDPNISHNITRITLFLHDRGHASDLESQHQRIVQQFHEIDGNHLLFLKKIRRIEIKFSYEEGNHTMKAFQVTSPTRVGRVTLNKMGGDTPLEQAHYHVTKYTAPNFPGSDDNDYSECEESSSGYSKAEVILAFPLDDKSLPIIETQQMFTFLPMRNMGFKFLVHLDIMTQANLQDILTTSARNASLGKHIAKAFTKAIEELCQDEILQFEWMRYLPQDHDYPWDSYWKGVISDMKSDIAATNLMRSRSNIPLKNINHLRRLVDNAIDSDGEPLFEDVVPELYPCKSYKANALSCLRNWGLDDITMDEILDRVEADLKRNLSRLKSPQSSEAWHSKAAKLIDVTFQRKLVSCQARVRGMDLIPVQNGKWISAAASQLPIVFPTTGGVDNGVDIPKTLDLHIIDDVAAGNASRRNLFEHLGAETLPASAVRELILDKYRWIFDRTTAFGASGDEVKASLSHLAFLYLTHESHTYVPNRFRFIWVFTSEGLLSMPKYEEVYIMDNHKYGIKGILEGLPEFRVTFLSPIYLDTPPKLPNGKRHNISWSEWLRKYINVLSRPKLIANGAITSLFWHIIKHQSSQLLGILQHYWSDIKQEVQDNKTVRDEICKASVNLRGRSIQLLNTFLPIPELRSRASEYLDGPALDKFPFLDLSDTMTSDDLSKWDFLHDTLNVGNHENIEFYMTILSILAEHNPAPGLEVSSKVFALCELIHQKSRESSDTDTCQSQQRLVREYFETHNLVPLPGRYSRPWVWKCPSMCRWDAPSSMMTVTPVEYLLNDVFRRKDTDRAALEQFLRIDLQIRDCSWEDMTHELKTRENSSFTIGAATQLYEHLHKVAHALEQSERMNLVKQFQDNGLIFVAGSWHRSESCLWSSATSIDGKVLLNESYPNLEDFFVNILGIKTLTLQMVYDKLKNTGLTDKSSVIEVKKDWAILNSFLPQAEIKPDPSPLLRKRLFPVRHPDGSVELCSLSAPFAIIDRKPLGRLFSGKANLLDYSFNEVHKLRNTFQWLGLNVRFLSVCVQEVSTLVGGIETPISEPDRDLKSKAHALYRVAIHFKSQNENPSSKSLYDLLRTVKVLETDGIAAELHLKEGTQTIVVEKSRSNLHIDWTGRRLRVYVPYDFKKQQLCYLNTLPRRLYEWMIGDEATKLQTTEREACILIITQILNASCNNINALLRDHGITEVDFIDEYHTAAGSSSSAGARSRTKQDLFRSKSSSGLFDAFNSAVKTTPSSTRAFRMVASQAFDSSHLDVAPPKGTRSQGEGPAEPKSPGRLYGTPPNSGGFAFGNSKPKSPKSSGKPFDNTVSNSPRGLWDKPTPNASGGLSSGTATKPGGLFVNSATKSPKPSGGLFGTPMSNSSAGLSGNTKPKSHKTSSKLFGTPIPKYSANPFGGHVLETSKRVSGSPVIDKKYPNKQTGGSVFTTSSLSGFSNNDCYTPSSTLSGSDHDEEEDDINEDDSEEDDSNEDDSDEDDSDNDDENDEGDDYDYYI